MCNARYKNVNNFADKKEKYLPLSNLGTSPAFFIVRAAKTENGPGGGK